MMKIRKFFQNKICKIIALVGLGLGGIVVAPVAAQAAVTCSSVTLSGGVYPSGHLYYCGSNPANGNIAASALYGLGADAKMRLNDNNHTFYIFANPADYYTYRGQTNTTPTPPLIPFTADQTGITDNTGPVFNTLVFEDRLTTYHLYMDNVVAHEAGHHLDYIYGHKLYTRNSSFPAGVNTNDWFSAEINKDFYYRLLGFKATIGGQVEANDLVKIQFAGIGAGTGNPPAPVTVSYTVKATDTLQKIAQELVILINGNATLTGSVIKGSATQDAGTATIRFYSSSPLSYFISSTYTSPVNHIAPTLQGYDFATFAARSPQCKSTGAIFTPAYDTRAPVGVGQPICGSLQSIDVRGTPAVNDVYRIVVTDSNVPGSPINVDFTETSPASQASVAAGLVSAINSNSSLLAKGITAVLSGGSIAITSGTNTTSYTATKVSGPGTGTLRLNAIQVAGGDTVVNLYKGKTNPEILQAPTSWEYFFTSQDPGGNTPIGALVWNELFAELTATNSGNSDPTHHTPDFWVGNSNYFPCVAFMVQRLEATGDLPKEIDYPSICK